MTEEEKYIAENRKKVAEAQEKLDRLAGKVNGAPAENRKDFIDDYDAVQTSLTRARDLLHKLEEADVLEWEGLREEFRDVLISTQSGVDRMSSRW